LAYWAYDKSLEREQGTNIPRLRASYSRTIVCLLVCLFLFIYLFITNMRKKHRIQNSTQNNMTGENVVLFCVLCGH